MVLQNKSMVLSKNDRNESDCREWIKIKWRIQEADTNLEGMDLCKGI